MTGWLADTGYGLDRVSGPSGEAQPTQSFADKYPWWDDSVTGPENVVNCTAWRAAEIRAGRGHYGRDGRFVPWGKGEEGTV